MGEALSVAGASVVEGLGELGGMDWKCSDLDLQPVPWKLFSRARVPCLAVRMRQVGPGAVAGTGVEGSISGRDPRAVWKPRSQAPRGDWIHQAGRFQVTRTR